MDEYQKLLKSLNAIQLAALIKDLRRYPSDKEYLHRALKEMGHRQKGTPPC